MLQINSLSKSYGEQTLLEDASLTVNKGEHIGLIGPNGKGKTTLFKLITGKEDYDEGEILLPKRYKIGYLDQHISFSESNLLQECALALDEDHRHEDYRAAKILSGLGFSPEDFSRSPESFSGGQQIRIQLAKVLLTSSDLLLLDEPTNYLDILSLRWLKSFLRSWPKEFILITHDRSFMDEVTTHTCALSQKTLVKLKGNTSEVFARLELQEEELRRQKENQDRKKKEIQSFVDRFRAKSSKASLVQSRIKQLEKMDDVHLSSADAIAKMNFPYKKTHGKLLLDVKDLSFSYDTPLFSNLNFTIDRGDKVFIIGKNGKGKSTLIKLLSQELTPENGTIEFHPQCSWGVFGQTHQKLLDPNLTVLESLSHAHEHLTEKEVRTLCGSLLFSRDMALKKVKVLSGGEKNRILLGKLLGKETNLLFLDEPTHHLDMDTVDVLMNSLKKYAGSVLMVTHNEGILKKLATKLIIFNKNSVSYFNGTYNEFLEKIGWEEEIIGEKKKKTLSRKDKAKLIRDRNELLRPWRKKYDTCEEKLEKLENQKSELQEEIVSVSMSGDGVKISQLSQKLSNVEKDLETIWEELDVADGNIKEIMDKFKEVEED